MGLDYQTTGTSGAQRSGHTVSPLHICIVSFDRRFVDKFKIDRENGKTTIPVADLRGHARPRFNFIHIHAFSPKIMSPHPGKS